MWEGYIFSAHFGPPEHCLNTTAYLSFVADHIHCVTTSVLTHLVVKHKSPQSGFLDVTVSFLCSKYSLFSAVTRLQSNRAPLGYGRTGLCAGAADKSAAAANMDQDL